MNHQPTASIDGLILSRLLPASKAGRTLTEIVKTLRPFLSIRFIGHECIEKVKTGISRLIEDDAVREESRTETPRYRLTGSGINKAKAFLGAAYFPTQIQWKAIKEKYLPALGVGYVIRSASDLRFAKQRIQATVLMKELGLPPECASSKTAVLDALYWKVLGVDSAKPFTKTAAKPFFIKKILNIDSQLSGKTAENLLLAKLTAAANQTEGAIQIALVQKLIGLSPESEKAAGADINNENSPLKEFVERVSEAAQSCQTGRFGPDKIFINHVWNWFQKHNPEVELEVGEFKQKLLEAHRARLLTLSREDLPDLQNRQDITESEVVFLNTPFHHIRI